jgi:NADPH-dependent 2,4-dienoyl-CoA reductase/sulfur reductase-like enzyme/peroxiredoxin family protein/rhodanese-related sulfurtransferase/TusA-related sulfurtransferase
MGKKVLIVGGVAGGATAAARMRRLDEDAEIILFERGEYISFANCGLPYFIGGVITEEEKLTLQTPESFHDRFNVDVRVLNEVTAINRGQKTVTVRDLQTGKEYSESYDYLILSPGSAPILPPLEGATSEAVFTLRNIPDTFRIRNYVKKAHPRHAVVGGAGYIGIEMAENLHEAGVDVSIVELMDHVIQPLDADMAGEVHQHILDMGVGLYLNIGVTAIADGGSHARYRVRLNNGGHIDADMVIMAVGVRPESNLAKDAGLTLGTRGCISVDESMRTSDPFIYAVGDAVEVTDLISGRKVFVPLASPANRQGRIAADNINGGSETYGGVQGTAILKAFDMTVAVTGSNEKTLIDNGIEYRKSYTFSGNHASYYPGASYMTIKLLFTPATGKLLGAQVTGYEGTDKRIDVLATAIRARMTVYDLQELELAYAPPFGSAKDPVNMAGYTAGNLLQGSWKPFYWQDIAGLDPQKVTLLDVRTEEEFANGTLEGAYNMPLDDIRERCATLDKDKPVYVFCQVGLRGYIASRILTAKGFDVYNLAGGYRFATMARTPTPPTPPARRRAHAAPDDAHMMELSEKSPAHHGTDAEGAGVSAHGGKRAEASVKVDACGLQCPGPIMKVHAGMQHLLPGQILEITANDPAFAGDVEAWCRRTGNELLENVRERGTIRVRIRKGAPMVAEKAPGDMRNDKNIIVFSGDLDKAIAALIIANGAAAMGRKVNMFFTFWGLNILRKAQKVKVRKTFMEKMFSIMMPRGANRLKLSQMNMAGAGAAMIRNVMRKKNISSLTELIDQARENGVEFTACTMSMDVMGIKMEELLEGTKMGGVAAMLGTAEESDMSLFI